MVLVSDPKCFAWTMKNKENGVLISSLEGFEILPWTEHTPGQQRKLEVGYIQKIQACHGMTTSKQKLWIPYFLEDFDKHTEIALKKKREVMMMAHPQGHMKTVFSTNMILKTF